MPAHDEQLVAARVPRSVHAAARRRGRRPGHPRARPSRLVVRPGWAIAAVALFVLTCAFAALGRDRPAAAGAERCAVPAARRRRVLAGCRPRGGQRLRRADADRGDLAGLLRQPPAGLALASPAWRLAMLVPPLVVAGGADRRRLAPRRADDRHRGLRRADAALAGHPAPARSRAGERPRTGRIAARRGAARGQRASDHRLRRPTARSRRSTPAPNGSSVGRPTRSSGRRRC